MIPAAMAVYRQFILYNEAKLPINPHTFEVGDAHDPAIWVSADEAKTLAEYSGLGIGFVFTDQDPFFFLDIDKCLEESGQWSNLALKLCNMLQGCYVEVSKSGKGLHIFGIAGSEQHGCKNSSLGIELYTSGRYAALTGYNAQGDANVNPGASYSQIVAEFFPAGTADNASSLEWTDGPVDGYSGPVDDQVLIEKMLKSRSAAGMFSGRASIADLWNKNVETLIKCFPPIQAGPFDHSSADAALCSHLAFWTGKDCTRMERLFGMSALARDKWTSRKKYRRTTIENAVNKCKNTLGSNTLPAGPVAPDGPSAPGSLAVGTIRDGFQFLTIENQIKLFAGCVYVRDAHKALVPDGALLKPDQFKAIYGGYVFAVDTLNDKTNKNAWQAFTESQGCIFPKANSTCFRPEHAPMAIIEEEGTTLVNTYVPINTRSIPGDPSPFLDHLKRLLPNDGDRQILLAYMAACVQYLGKKFQWAPLIQGIEGNGKSFLSSAVSKAVGLRYTHKANPKDIGNVFNAWITNKLFVTVSEIYVADRQDLIDTLKWLITDERVPITPKGVDQVTGDNRANLILESNHKDAIRKTRGDRRYCVFYTAQQDPEDLQRDGMSGDYFPALYDWLRADGYAIITNYLRSYVIPDVLNPATKCHRAPITSSTNEALALSLGGVEQEILAAIEEDRPGFAGGWISSMALDRLLVEKKADRRIPRNRRKIILKDLGYIPHPTLNDGRTDNPIAIDGGKPRLYIKQGHINCNIVNRADVVTRYTEAQTGGNVSGNPGFGKAGVG